MIPWKLLGRAAVPGGGPDLVLYSRGKEFSIRTGSYELMNSGGYSREDGLSKIGCTQVRSRKKARVLIGGLGMGYSLITALDNLERDAEVVVAELVPGVIEWNRSVYGHLAGHPLRDRRAKLREADVSSVIRERKNAYDAILLDVDNGAEALTRRSNDWLYSDTGIAYARDALRPNGVLGYWSAGPDRGFVARLRRASLDVKEVVIRARGGGRGSRTVLWFATRIDKS
jgi:spermidine synthase